MIKTPALPSGSRRDDQLLVFVIGGSTQWKGRWDRACFKLLLSKFGHLIINDYIVNPEMTWTVHPAEELDLLEAKVQLKSNNFKN